MNSPYEDRRSTGPVPAPGLPELPPVVQPQQLPELDQTSAVRLELRRSRTPLTVGLSLAAAAVVLSVFAGWPWFPWAVGLGVAVVLNLVGLRKLLAVWAFPAMLAPVVVMLASQTAPLTWVLVAGVALVVVAIGGRPRLAPTLKGARWARLAAGVVGAAVAVVSGLGTVEHHTQQVVEQQKQDQASQQSSKDGLRPHSAGEVLTAVARTVAQDNTILGCFLFSPNASVAFARAAGAADCPGAIHALHAKVSDTNGYGSLFQPAQGASGTGFDAHETVSGCDVGWMTGPNGGPDPGPHLGVFTLEKTPNGGGYLITGYAPCP